MTWTEDKVAFSDTVNTFHDLEMRKMNMKKYYTT